MKHLTLISIAAAVMFAALPITASATPDVGKPAPAFSGTDSRGKTISLGDFRGKTVVLEWTNHDCPYVRKHYSADNMQTLQRKAAPTGIVLDPKGTIGRQYAARHTPTMVVIDPKGTLAYYGAIDDDSNWHPDSIKGAKNHVRAALADLKAGRAVSVAKTRAYGRSVKYTDCAGLSGLPLTGAGHSPEQQNY